MLARLLLPTAAWCGLLAACAAQDPAALTALEDSGLAEYEEAASRVAMPELGESLSTVVEEEATISQEPGPGFRWFVRGMVGGGADQEDSGFSESFVQLTSGIGNPISFTLRLDILNVEEVKSHNGLELMAIHLWDGEWGIVNRRPAWTVRANSAGVFLALGQLPIAERAPLREPGDRDSRNWYERFTHANYFSYGIAVVHHSENFYFDGESGVVGRVYTSTTGKNTLSGPQISLGRVVSNGRWSLDLNGSLLMGYVESEVNQKTGFGDPDLPGGGNPLLYSQPTYSLSNAGQSGIASHADLRLTSSYYLKHNWSLDATASLFIGGPFYSAPSQIVQYNMPDFGIDPDRGDDYATGATLFLGATYLR